MAVGDAVAPPGYRYLIGSENLFEVNIYSWDDQELKWNNAFPSFGAENIISYKDNDNGDYAFCAVYDGPILKTVDAGFNWSTGGAPPNQIYSSIEIINPEQISENQATVFVGTGPYQGLATVYYSTDAGASWARLGGDEQTDPIYGLRIHDIESVQSSFLTVGTDDGLYSHEVGNYGSAWQYLAFEGLAVKAIETVDLQDDEQLAAIFDGQDWSLHYTDDGWASHQEVSIGGQSFNKEVHDIAGIGWDDPAEPKSFYLATSEGLFLLKFEGNLQNIYLYDLGNDAQFGYDPIRYDKNFKSVDYHFYEEGNQKHAKILASTRYNVYEIHEIRDINLILDIFSVEFSEIVTGTYLCNVVGVSFPENTEDSKKILTVTENALVKKYDAASWRLVGLAFTGSGTGRTGTDVTADLDGPNEDYVLVSSKTPTGGTIMYSSDGGDTWYDRSPIGNPIVKSIDMARGTGPNENDAFAAGGDYVWRSYDNGYTWEEPDYFVGADFNDVMVEPNRWSPYIAFVGGAQIYKLSESIGWTPYDYGMPGDIIVNEFAPCNMVTLQLYAATNQGVYKHNGLLWSPRTAETGSVNMRSISDESGPWPQLGSIAISSEEGPQPDIIWASGDSARSWSEILKGEIALDVSINRLAVATSGDEGFAAATSDGIFYIGDMFKHGYFILHGEETWGPGNIIINGDVFFWSTNPEPLDFSIVPPCKIIFTHNYDWIGELQYPEKSELVFRGDINVKLIGDIDNRIIITSSRDGNGQAGDWGEITIMGDVGETSSVDFQYCDFEFGNIGLASRPYDPLGISAIDSVIILNCSFSDMKSSGINLFRAGVRDSMIISGSMFDKCDSYGVRVEDVAPDACIWITGNEITDCDYGIWYSGNENLAYQNIITIKGNTISRTSPGANTYGISLSKFDGQGNAPVSTLRLNSISNFVYGIHLNSLTIESVLWGNTIQSCNNYGLFLENSSPSLIGAPLIGPNEFLKCKIGIYCDANSNPHVRMTRIKNNDIGGVLIEPHDFTPGVPDFGTVSDWGKNSISYTLLPVPPAYYDMKHQALSSEIPAERNWWGERLPNPFQIVGRVDYDPWLTEDPLAPYPKREPWYSNLPNDFGMRQNYPNPFNPITSISFYVAEPGFASLKIYNLNGQLVNTLVSDHLASGEHKVIWDGRNSAGQEVSSGIYFSILKTDYGKASKKMVLLR